MSQLLHLQNRDKGFCTGVMPGLISTVIIIDGKKRWSLILHLMFTPGNHFYLLYIESFFKESVKMINDDNSHILAAGTTQLKWTMSI